MKRNLKKVALGFALLGAIQAVPAQDLLTFSGGDGTPLTITLNADVQYTLQSGVNMQYGMGIGIYNAYASIQSPYSLSCDILSGFTVTDSRLGVLSQSVFNAGVPGLAPSPNNTANLDYQTFYLFPNLSSPPVFEVGDIITISAGTVVTSGDYALAAPTITPSSNLVLFDGMENQLAPITPAPEPSTLALFAAGGLLLICRWKAKSPSKGI